MQDYSGRRPGSGADMAAEAVAPVEAAPVAQQDAAQEAVVLAQLEDSDYDDLQAALALSMQQS